MYYFIATMLTPGSGNLHCDGDELPPASSKRCDMFRRRLLGEMVDVTTTGSKLSNTLVEFLKCEVKADPRLAACKPRMKDYEICHGSVMGSGKYQGKSDCGWELAELCRWSRSRRRNG